MSPAAILHKVLVSRNNVAILQRGFNNVFQTDMGLKKKAPSLLAVSSRILAQARIAPFAGCQGLHSSRPRLSFMEDKLRCDLAAAKEAVASTLGV